MLLCNRKRIDKHICNLRVNQSTARPDEKKVDRFLEKIRNCYTIQYTLAESTRFPPKSLSRYVIRIAQGKF